MEKISLRTSMKKRFKKVLGIILKNIPNVKYKVLISDRIEIQFTCSEDDDGKILKAIIHEDTMSLRRKEDHLGPYSHKYIHIYGFKKFRVKKSKPYYRFELIPTNLARFLK